MTHDQIKAILHKTQLSEINTVLLYTHIYILSYLYVLAVI